MLGSPDAELQPQAAAFGVLLARELARTDCPALRQVEDVACVLLQVPSWASQRSSSEWLWLWPCCAIDVAHALLRRDHLSRIVLALDSSWQCAHPEYELSAALGISSS